MIRIADYIMKRIAEEGVRHVFYVPGGQCFYLTDALRRTEQLEGISMHHEQSAAMAALSYSVYNENLGACLVTTGCAGTNTMTGLLHAWQDSIPCIFISGQQNYNQTIAASGLPLRQVGVQEADITTIVSSITKYAITIDRAEDIVYHVDKALYLAKSGRQGPVWIDVPLNIQNSMVDVDKLQHYVPEQAEVQKNFEEEIDYVVQCLNQAKRPVILAGQGIRSAHAKEKLREFAEKNKIPTVFTRFSYDLMPYGAPCNFGIVSGIAGASRYGNFIIQNADLVLSVGSRLSIDTTGPEREKFAREAKIVVVDIDEVEHSKKGVSIDRLICMDARVFLEKMCAAPVGTADSQWMEKCNHWKKLFEHVNEQEGKEFPIDMKYAMSQISDKLPKESVLLSDAGLTGAAMPAASRIGEQVRIIHSFAQGEMGYALPGACGVAALAKGPVLAYSGDGSFMMNLQELQTVVRNQFNLKIIIMNNNGYSGVRHGQKAHFRGKTIGTDPSNGIDFPDYEKIAAAFLLPFFRVQKASELKEGISRMFADDKPFVLEIMTDPEQIDLHNGLVTYGKHKFGFRPIEDQSPFIDREVFFREMIVEPLETSYGKPV